MTTFTAMPKYEAYKDSGVDWLGDIPVGWSLIKLKRILKFQTGGTPSTSDSLGYEGDLPWVTIADLDGRFTTKFHRISSRGVKSANIPLTPKGSLLYSFKLSIGQVAFSDRDLYTNEAIASFCNKEGINLRYFYYSLPIFLEKNAATNIYGAFLLNQDLIKNAQIINLSIEEQFTIANFLDEKTAKIDEAIAIKEKQIELLKERKQIIIQQAVTQGLDPAVPMKDSGVEWIGQIPAHWDITPLKYICRFMGGGTPSKENASYWTDGSIPWVSPKDMKSTIINKTEDYITPFAVKNSSTNFIKAGSLLMVVRSGILQRTIPVAINTVDVTLNQDMKALSFSEHINTEYVMNFIIGNNNSLLNVWTKEGATVESIEFNYLANSPMVIPPINEQEKITNFIRDNSNKVDLLIKFNAKQIEKLKEYKTTLINSAVTGKIKVV